MTTVRKTRKDAGIPRVPKSSPRVEAIRYFLTLSPEARKSHLDDLRMFALICDQPKPEGTLEVAQ